VTQTATDIGGKPIEKVGVILVHGIGEQRRFEHLDSETRKITDAILAQYGKRRRDVTVTLTPASGDAFQGSQSSWVSGPDAPLHVLIDMQDRIVDIGFHEVWWADINETLTLGKQIRFWFWGLSLPGVATYNYQILPGADDTRPPDNAGRLTWWHRIRMGYVAVLFGFSAFSIALINTILKRLKFSPVIATSTIVNYMSAVKLYSQDTRVGGSPMDGPDEPPRAAIRRRMIRTIVDVATADYQRWYILAHSLGSVVAWNGLMETEKALPNYLDEARWNALKDTGLQGTAQPFHVNAMMPNRPVWLGADETIQRENLFARFRGLLTYGAPLERFGALWSRMVPINSAEQVFSHDAEWVNVFDPTDPVGTWISNFNPRVGAGQTHGVLKPQNFPCRASGIVLLSHIRYLNKTRLVHQLAQWLAEGGSLTNAIAAERRGHRTFWMPLPQDSKPTWGMMFRTVSRYLQWIIIGLLLSALTLLSIHYLIIPTVKGVVHWMGYPDF
jgi:hypothetical protein